VNERHLVPAGGHERRGVGDNPFVGVGETYGHKHWDSAAVGWKKWSEFNDSADGHIIERLVELAGVRSGSRVLDVAAGYGEPALTARA